MARTEFEAKWHELHQKFSKAESESKTAENLEAELGIPSINELRYAGYHAIRARMCELGALDDNDTSVKEELARACRHCDRSIYDSNEVQMTWYLERLGETHQAYAHSHVTDIVAGVVDGYIHDLVTLDQATDFLRETKLEHENREKYYQACEPHLEQVRCVYRKWKNSAPVIDAAIRRAWMKRIWTVAGVLAATLAAMAAIIGALSS